MKLNFVLLVGLLAGLATTPPVAAQEVLSVEQQEVLPRSLLAILLGDAARYDIITYKMVYTTTNTAGLADTVSGMLSIPQDPSIAFPLAIYNHGTVTNPDGVPSRTGVAERQLVNAFATGGYAVAAPDYLGLGDDTDSFHPYVHAASEAQAGRDMLIALRSWLTAGGNAPNGQVFVTGYSQGGHAAQALHRNLQLDPGNDSLTVTAASHLSGPYSISDVMRNTIFSDSLTTVPGYIIYTYTAYNKVYGLFDSLGQVFVPPYLPVIEEFSDGVINAGEFNAQLRQLLSDNEDRLVDMFQDSIATQLASGDTTTAIVRALRDNDTYEWAPEAPTLIYYCSRDDQVPFANAILADSVMRSRGATQITLATGGALTHTECVLPAALATLAFFEQYAVREAASLGRPVQLPGVAVFPNPVRSGGTVTVSGQIGGRALPYLLYDGSGRLLRTGQIAAGERLQLPANLRPGLHLLRLQLDGGNFLVRRLLVR